MEGLERFWRVWRVLEGVWRVWRVLEGLEGFGAFGAFAGWQTEALKAHRKPLLWPWPWGACLGSGLGPGVPAGDGVWRVLEGVWKVWRVWKVLAVWSVAGGQTAALKAHRKPLLWPWPWGACWGSGLGPGVPAGQGVWRVWTVLESARRVWRVLEGLEGLEGFGGWSDRTSSTPAVVPGAAPALAKAGVGGESPCLIPIIMC